MSARIVNLAGPSRRRRSLSLVAVAAGVLTLGSVVGGGALEANAATTPAPSVIEIGNAAQSSTFTVTNTAGKLVASNFSIGDSFVPWCPTGSTPSSAGIQYSVAGGPQVAPAVSVVKNAVMFAGVSQGAGTLFHVKVNLPNSVAQAALNKTVTAQATVSCKSGDGVVYTGTGPVFHPNTAAATKRGTFWVSSNGSAVTAKEAASGAAPAGYTTGTSSIISSVHSKAWKTFTSTKTAGAFNVKTNKGFKLTANASLSYAKGTAGKAGSNLVATTVWNGIASYTVSTAKYSHTF